MAIDEVRAEDDRNKAFHAQTAIVLNKMPTAAKAKRAL